MCMEPIADKKRAIFESTLELVNENGFHGTPMSLVAKRAGVAAGTIYHYFESKDKLICELFKYSRGQVVEIIQREDCATVPYRECFFNLWFGLYTYYRENPNVFRFFEQFTNSPYNAPKGELEHDDFFRLLFRFLERGIEGSDLRAVSPQILGVIFHSSIVSHLKVQTAGRLKLRTDELEQIPQILWDGMKSM